MIVYYISLNKDTYSIREALLTETMLCDYKEDTVLDLIANEYLLYDIEDKCYVYALDTRFSEEYEESLSIIEILSKKNESKISNNTPIVSTTIHHKRIFTIHNFFL